MAGRHSAESRRRTDDRLCDVCFGIDFDRYLGEKLQERVNLGTWFSISRSQRCPFCRLVVHSLRSDPTITPRSAETLVDLDNELSWKLGIEMSPYDLSKSVSYSNKFDLRSKSQQYRTDAYRFIVIPELEEDDVHQESEMRGAYIQYLAYKEKTDEGRHFFGRMVRDTLDIDLLRLWLEKCSKYHGWECREDRGTDGDLPSSLRLIDVNRRGIVKIPGHEYPEYVILSYVWGKDVMKQQTGMEPVVLLRDAISRTGDTEFTPLPKRLPRTIEDAIYLTNSLAYRYLWVDALCIIQDDPFEQKVLHLSSMKAIYSCASLTIAAAAGLHADYGLLGISVPRGNTQYVEKVDGLNLATMFPSFSELEASNSLLWNTRGWTFQEKLLSRRILLFTNYQVYFKCSESIWTEEVAMETDRLSKSVEARRGKYSWKPDRQDHVPTRKALELKTLNPRLHIDDDWGYLRGFLEYTAAIREYTKRSLSDPKDILFAITGVLETMENVTGKFLLGLPQNHFLESLLWYPEVGCVHSYGTENNLPSWTWASWNFSEKGINFKVMDVRKLRALLQASRDYFNAYFAKESDKSSSSNANEEDDENNPFTLVGTFGNLLTGFAWPLFQKDHTITEVFAFNGEKLTTIKPNLPLRTFNCSGSNSKTQSIIQKLELYSRFGKTNWKPSIDDLPKKKHALTFKTVIVRFRIGGPLLSKNHKNNMEAGIFEILNLNGECVGEIRTTYSRAMCAQSEPQDFLTISWGLSLEHAEICPSYVPRWKLDSRRETASSDDKWETLTTKSSARLLFGDVGWMPIAQPFFQRLEQYMPKYLKQNLLEPRPELGTASQLFLEAHSAKKGEERPRSLWPVVNVILVDWDGGMARRAGIGKVVMKAWQERWNPRREIIFI